MSSVVVTTARLHLRKMTSRDLPHLLRIFSDPVAMQYYPGIMNEEETMEWIQRTLKNYDAYGVGFWVVEENSTGQFLGQCGIIPQALDGTRQMETAYLFVRSQWGQGYATEAALACKQYGFETMGYPKLISLIDAQNTRSMRVAERIGMQVEPTISKWGKEEVYSILC